MRRGWWRSNWWGLLAVVPAIVLALWSPTHDAIQRYQRTEPHTPITSTPGGWVSFGQARMRLTALTQVTDLKDFSGNPAKLPGGLTAWQAKLSFETTKPDSIGGCQLRLEDTAGTTYGSDPTELEDYDLPFSTGCLSDSLAATPAPTFDTVAFFVMPGTARPAAVWVTLATQNPRYARLIAP